MIIEVENFGPIKQASVDVSAPLVVFLGPNGTGKTWFSYLIYGLHREPIKKTRRVNHLFDTIQNTLDVPNLDEIIRAEIIVENSIWYIFKFKNFLNVHLEDILKTYTQAIQQNLTHLFTIESKYFKTTQIKLELAEREKSLLSSEIELAQKIEVILSQITRPHLFYQLFDVDVDNGDFRFSYREGNEGFNGGFLTSFIIDTIKEILHNLLFEDTYFSLAERNAINLFVAELTLNRFADNFQFEKENILSKLEDSEREIETTMEEVQEILNECENIIRSRVEDGYQEDVIKKMRTINLESLTKEHWELIKSLERILDEQTQMVRDVGNYPQPIFDALIFTVKALTGHGGMEGPLAFIAEELEKDVLKGSVERQSAGGFYYRPNDVEGLSLPLKVSASIVKSLAGLVVALKYKLKPGDLVLIDEPELNLHGDSQRELIKVIARMINAGLRVVVSTHSYTILQEINNVIMLGSEKAKKSKEKREELMKEYKYAEENCISPGDCAAYWFGDGTITPLPMDDAGIVADKFRDLIRNINQTTQDIYYDLIEEN